MKHWQEIGEHRDRRQKRVDEAVWHWGEDFFMGGAESEEDGSMSEDQFELQMDFHEAVNDEILRQGLIGRKVKLGHKHSALRTAWIKVEGDTIYDLIEDYLVTVAEKTDLGFDEGYWDQGSGAKFWMTFEQEGWSEYEPGQTVSQSWKVVVSLKGKQIYATDWSGRKVYKKISIDPMTAGVSKLVKAIKAVSGQVPMPVDPNQPDTPSLPRRQW
jgi:hypothetical protein